MNNYKLLPALISILQTRNLTESAKELHVTQSAMSRTLAQIREAFDDQIVVRQANVYVLTARGESLKQQLPSLLQQLDSLYVPPEFDPAQSKRQFSFASSDYVAQAILPDICAELAKVAPNTSIEFHLWQKQWLSNLADHPFDIVSTIGEAIPENLYGKKMAQDQQVIVMRHSHPLATKSVNIDEYVEAKHVVITGGGDKDSPVEHALYSLGKKRQIFARVPFFQSAIELLLKTDTLLTTPLHIAVDFVQRYDLQIKPLPITIKEHHYYLLWHAKYQQDSEHQWFRRLCYPALQHHLQATIEQGMSLLHDSQ